MLKSIDCRYLSEASRWGVLTGTHNPCFEKKKKKTNLSENFKFLVVNFSVNLNRQVFVMLCKILATFYFHTKLWFWAEVLQPSHVKPVSLSNCTYPRQAKSSKLLTSTCAYSDNCPSWISIRKRMTAENISRSILTRKFCWTRWEWTHDLLITNPPRIQLNHRCRPQKCLNTSTNNIRILP